MKGSSILFSGILFAVILLLLHKKSQQRDRRLTEKYEKFRASFHDEHERIDAQFHHYDTVVDGLKWHYVDEGPKDGPTILFMHGFPETWYSWRYVLPLMDKNYRLIAVDMKGYGRSDKTDDDYRWSVVAEQTKDFMTKGLGIEKFYVVGHDWGSIIASVLVNNHQDNVLGFVRLQLDLKLPSDYKSTGAYGTFRERPQFLYFQVERVAKFILQDTAWILDRIYSPRLLTPFRQIDHDYFTYEFSQPGFYHLYRYFLVKNWDFETAIVNICKNNFAFPVLQLEADSDPAQPVESFDNVDVECPNVELVWIQHSNHFSGFDRPDAVAENINQFVAKNEERLKRV